MSTISQFHSYESIKEEVSLVIIKEADIVNFHKLLEDIRQFAIKDVPTRNRILVDISFWKGEFDHRRRLAESLLIKKRAVRYNKVLEKFRATGVRYSEEMIRNEVDAMDNDAATDNLFKINEVCKKWATTLTDCYYALKSTHDILSNVVN